MGIISSGDEIIEPGKPMQAGLVYDSNARILADAVSEAGGLPQSLGIVSDDLEQLRAKLSAGLQSCDMVLLSGGTSKGGGDVSYHAVGELTDPGVVVHGVALKPGKPICLAASQQKPVVILPGFPTSAIFTFHEFVVPVIEQLAGLRKKQPRSLPARLSVKINSSTGRTEYVLVNLGSNPMNCERYEPDAHLWVETLDRFHQADVAFLDQVQELQPAVGVFLGDRDNQPEVGLDHFLLGLRRLALALLHGRNNAAEFADGKAGLLRDFGDAGAGFLDVDAVAGGEPLPALARQLGNFLHPVRV